MAEVSLGPVEPLLFRDSRGELQVLLETEEFVVKRSFSTKGVARGLHIQRPPSNQTKYIRVLEGSIVDVCLNLDPSSGSFGEIKRVRLTPSVSYFCVPSHYAHGFVCEEDTTFEYICVGRYNEKNEVVIQMTADVLFEEPLQAKTHSLILSEKDQRGVSMNDALALFAMTEWRDC